MSDLKPYPVTIYGLPHTLLLSDEDAEKQGFLSKGSHRAADNVLPEPAAQAVPEPRRPGRPKLPRDEHGNILRDQD